MTWRAYTQSGEPELIDSLGAELSRRINCPVHFPAYNKNIFECMCGVIFPLYVVKGKDWPAIITKHDEERKLSKA